MSQPARQRRKNLEEETWLLLLPMVCGLAALIVAAVFATSAPTILLPAVTRVAQAATLSAIFPTITPDASSSRTQTPTDTATSTRTQTPTPTPTRVTIAPSGSLEGFVFNFSKQPIGDAEIALPSLKTLTNADGFYSFKNVPAGNYLVTAFANNYETQTHSVSVPVGQAQRQDFLLARAALKPINTITLNGNNCFSFDSGVISQAQNVAAPFAVILRCPATADIWWQTSNSISAVNNNTIDYSKGKSFEDCPVTQSILIKLAQPGEIYCALTVQRRTAVIFVSRVNLSDHLITFDWLLY